MPAQKIGVVFGLGAVFGILMSRGAYVHCHKAAILLRHRCNKHAPTKQVDVAQDKTALLDKDDN